MLSTPIKPAAVSHFSAYIERRRRRNGQIVVRPMNYSSQMSATIASLTGEKPPYLWL
jgi:hypothetical protein